MDASIIAMAQSKGGVGKTTSALNLSCALAERDYKVLMMDLDPQAGLTFSLGFQDPEEEFRVSAYDVLEQPKRRGKGKAKTSGPALEDAIIETSIEGVHLVPSHIDLVELDYAVTQDAHWQYLLQRKIYESKAEYDCVVLDCPPSLGALTRMAILASHLVMVPVQAEWLALRGLMILNRMISEIRDDFLDDAHFFVRYFVTMQQQQTRHGREVYDLLKTEFGDDVMQTRIHRSVAFPDSSASGKPILMFAGDHKGAGAYRDLATELLEMSRQVVQNGARPQAVVAMNE